MNNKKEMNEKGTRFLPFHETNSLWEETLIRIPQVQDGMGFLNDDEEEEEAGNSFDKEENQKKKEARRKAASDTPALDHFGFDMTKAAEKGILDPVVGREKEIERLAQILSRRKKNNPILIGEPGVGKSAIVEGLATRINEHKVSRTLFDKRIISLDLTSVVAGTKYRGQFEERIKSIINELQANKNIILFIDEIHTIIGAGSAPGSMDAANILKPALARGEIQCIGATTIDEYRKTIEKDGALERRFQKVLVEPATADETMQILENIKDRYEAHHNVTYTTDALQACVKLADRYISDRNFPDKAIDILDEAGSRVRIANVSVPKEIESKEEEIKDLKHLKTEAVRMQNFELAAGYRDKEATAEVELEKAKQDWEKRLSERRETVDEQQIEKVVSMMSGVPVQKMAQGEEKRLRNMYTEFSSKVIGQQNAIEKLCKAIQRNRLGLNDPNRPIGVFMFLGPTGVGKTYLTQQLALYMFGSKDALIRIDMSEYMEKFTVSRLVGAPPGYVGYEEGGQLTEKVRRHPYSIVLLDEIEKAHADVYNLLLQIMDEGRLTDSYGRTVDFKNTIIIMTSNCGTRQLKDFGTGIGFKTPTANDTNTLSRSIIQKALRKQFAPEFLNRLDDLIMFDQLGKESILQIVKLETDKVIQRIAQQDYHLRISDSALNFLADKGYDVQFGARPLRRAIQTYIEDELCDLILNEKVKAGDTVQICHKEHHDKLSFTTRKKRNVAKTEEKVNV